MLFENEMENYQEGDLTDIVRGRSKTPSSSNSSNYGCKDQPFSSQLFSSGRGRGRGRGREGEEEVVVEYSFGDPFCAAAAMRDPLLVHHQDQDQDQADDQELELAAFFNGKSSGVVLDHYNSSQDHDQAMMVMKRPASTSSCNIFSRMLQISPTTPTPTPTSSSISNIILSDHSSNSLINIPNNNSHHHFLDNNNNNPSSLQISSSPRNPPGIKRRKSQARKVVCVPAPVAASSRPNGEVIPSDLWAWRKYGQKPIKGSPYPRGYYRCSSSKGCSARKQVERSRTDPNMLVITYTSEHNHPWPTQRNALAGSSRSQQSKNNTPTPNSNSKLSAASGTKPTTTTTITTTTTTQDHDHDQIINPNNDGIIRRSTRSSISSSSRSVIKEEGVEQQLIETEEEGFEYRVALNGNNNQSDDFFADLEELETDHHPLSLLFTQTPKLDQISKGGGGGRLDEVVAFNNLFNWGVPEEPEESSSNNNNDNNSSFDQVIIHPSTTASKRGFY